MKRLLLAAILAVGVHVLLLGMELSWLNKKPLPRPKPRILTMTLAYRQPQRSEPKPAVRKPDLPSKKVVLIKKKVEASPVKRGPRPKPQKKISKPPEPVKTPTQPASPPEPKETQMVEEPGYPGPDLTKDNMHKEVSKSVDTGVGVPDAPVLQEVVQEAMPLYRINPPPEYPGVARKRGYQGTVVLEVMVDRNGKVGDLRVFTSSGYSILDKAAMTSVKGWSFEPGMRGDDKVEMWVRVPIRFRLK